ncbi:C-type natriuretic peptide 2-like [Rhinatrema bivittatum]|uniref:C-type natriuretic peptide 2-like n=1 Tax=Rhinatrema bivittatum TaxID=194408 RepID=UPI0011279C7C|nr:C-type natriuretic peptide 2-like [Rhinatrema bivittatum]
MLCGSLEEAALAGQKSLRSLLGEELAEYLASEERGDKAGLLKSRSRLLRDLHINPRARSASARLQNIRKQKSLSSSKNKSEGCFGMKLDRIGAMSNLGC